MSRTKFDEKELKVVQEVPGFTGEPLPVYDFPVSMADAMVDTFFNKKPWWIPTDIEVKAFTPAVIPDNGARGFVFEAQPYPREKFGGKDMFGVEWTYVDVAGGSMVKPGHPLLTDLSKWREKVIMPDIDSWDWEGSAKANKEYLASGFCNSLMLLNGCWFERLISFMDFEDAAVALIDEDEVVYVKEIAHELTDLYIKIIDKAVEAYGDGIHGICIHDDWGAQKSPFFSEEAARDIFLPQMKRFVDHCHSKGKYVDLHSCGHIDSRCNIFVEAGFDSWTPMAMNDTQKLYEDYGDKIVIGIIDDLFDPATATEEEQRAAARKFVEKYTKPGKVAMFSAFYNKPGMMTLAFREELYKASRIRYSEGE